MKKINTYLLSLMISILLISCSDDKNQTNPVYIPSITSISPNSAGIGDTIKVKGTNFGTGRGSGNISFTGTMATEYPSWSDTLIIVKVPAGAISGKLCVLTGGGKSNEIEFMVLKFNEGTVTDIDGNVYKTVKIGNQWWMAENLKVKHYRNGDSIPNVVNSKNWAALTDDAWCFYDNFSSFGATYGILYNWYAVNDNRNLAPDGWHVPTDAEWDTLAVYLGGFGVAGDKLKEKGTNHWFGNNSGATDETGFCALPGGCRLKDGTFVHLGTYSFWWTSCDYLRYCIDAWYTGLFYDSPVLMKQYGGQNTGYAIRCVMD